MIPKPKVHQLNEEYGAKTVFKNNLKRSSKSITFQTPKLTESEKKNFTFNVFVFPFCTYLALFVNRALIPSWCMYGVEWSKNTLNPSKISPKIDLEQTPHDKPSVLNEQKVARTILMNGSVPWIETNWPLTTNWPLPHTKIKIHSLNPRGTNRMPLCFTHKELTQGKEIAKQFTWRKFSLTIWILLYKGLGHLYIDVRDKGNTMGKLMTRQTNNNGHKGPRAQHVLIKNIKTA